MRMRPNAMPREGGVARAGLNLEEEDEKENDRHRWRQQQSQNDPGAKACEATCIFCVGMLFLQVAWILYTYGLAGTMNLLMAPEEPLGSGVHSTSTFLVVPPAGYGSEVVIAHDGEAGVQRLHYTAHGACCAALGVGCGAERVWLHAGAARVVVSDARSHTTTWLFYEAPRPGGGAAELAACYAAHNDSALRYGSLHPRDSFAQHSAFKLLAEVPEVAPTPAFDAAKCLPFARAPGAGLTHAPAAWTRAAAPAAHAPTGEHAGPPGTHGKWCGAGRGGFVDCCDGGACSACTALGGADAACLAQCKPADAVDAACAAHAGCVAKQPSGVATACAAAGSCGCLTELAAAVTRPDCGSDQGCQAFADVAATWAAKEALCWDAAQACQSLPCTTDAGAGWCSQCAFFAPCRTLADKPPAAAL
jgi:hypothetical protein